MDADAVAREIARPVRGCATDEQWRELIEAIAAELRRAHDAGLERAAGWCEKTGAFGPAYANAIRALKEAPRG